MLQNSINVSVTFTTETIPELANDNQILCLYMFGIVFLLNHIRRLDN